jgi:hypothetical protein
MRAGAGVALGLVLAAGAAGPACADGIVRIVNAANIAVTVRIDGSFGCRAQSVATAPPDMDMANRCSFGTTIGNHVLEFHFDDGKSSTRTVSVPAAGYAVTVNGTE